jgi:hypothetical protein
VAYLNLLAAVDPEQVAQLRGDAGFQMTPSKVVGVSHLLGYPGWVTHPPLAAVLAEALDGGELLTGTLWHPLRVPMYHPPGEALRVAPCLEEVWGATLARWPLSDDDWYRQPLPDGSRYTFLYPGSLQTVRERKGGHSPGTIAAVVLQDNGPVNAAPSPWDRVQRQMGIAVPYPGESVSVLVTPLKPRVARVARRPQGWARGDEVRRNEYIQDTRTQLEFTVYHSCFTFTTPQPAAAAQLRTHNSTLVQSFEVLPPGSSIPTH